MDDKIEHQGVVESIGENFVRITILQVAACSECKAKSLCNSSESKERIIDVNGKYDGLKIGDKVTVCGSLQMGKKAVRLAFVFPMFLLLLIGFVCLGMLNMTEGSVLLLMLTSMILYFSVVYFLKDRLERELHFWIEQE